MPKASRVAESSTSTSSAALVLSGALSGRRTLASKHTVGETGIELVIEDTAGNWLEGVYTYTSANPTTMTRTAILSSSNNDADVTFPAGTKTVFETASAGFLNSLSVGGGAAPIQVQAITTNSSALTLNFTANALETAYAVTLSQNVSITIGSAPVGYDQRMVVELIQDGTGGRNATFANPSWPGGIAPTFDTTANRHNTLMFRAVGTDVEGAAFSINRIPNVPQAPTAPSSITVTPGVAQNTINASPVAANPAVSGYTIYRGTSAGAESATAVAANVSLPYVDQGLTNGTTYYYKVAAVNSVSTGPQSPEGSGTPASAAPPGAPSSITVTPGDTVNTVNASPVTASPSVTGYTVYRGTSAGAESSTPIATNIALPYSDTGRTNGTTYYYKVAAVNANGTGPQSQEGSGTPAAAAVVHYLNFPGGSNNYAYLPNAAAYQVGSSAASLEVNAMVNSTTTETVLMAKWNDDSGVPDGQQYLFYRGTDGKLNVKWRTTANVNVSAASTVSDGVSSGVMMWRRVDFNPTTGAVSFYTSTDGSNYALLGTAVTASGTGAVRVPTSGASDILLGQSAGSVNIRPLTGRVYNARISVAGSIVLNGTVDTTGMLDSVSATRFINGPGVTTV